MGIFNYVFQGPCGGWGGNAHDPWLIPEDGVLTGFEVFSGDYINKIELFYTSPSVAPNGASQIYGGSDTGKSPGRVTLSTSPAEYVTEVSGKYDHDPGGSTGRVFLLQIITNLNAYKFGNDVSGWTSFAVPVPVPPSGGLAGLWGDAGNECDTVGVVTRFLKDPTAGLL